MVDYRVKAHSLQYASSIGDSVGKLQDTAMSRNIDIERSELLPICKLMG